MLWSCETFRRALSERSGISTTPTWDVEHEGGLVLPVAVLDDELVLVLVRGFDLWDAEHDHVVGFAVADQLVATAFHDLDGALENSLKLQ